MVIYFCMYGIILLFAGLFHKYAKDNKKARLWFCIIAFTIIVLMLGLRHPSMGNDLKYQESGGYLSSFKELSGMSWHDVLAIEQYLNYEKGYIIFNKLIGSIWNNEQFFIFMCAAVSVAPIVFFIYKKSESPLFSIIIFLGLPIFLMLYSGLRQAIAIGLCALAIHFTQEKKPIRFLITVLIAYYFHSTSFVMLVIYPLYNIKMKGFARAFSIVVIPIVYIFKNQLFAVLSKLFTDNDVELYGEGGITLFLVFSLIYVFCSFFNNYSKEQNGLLNLFLFACCCQAFGAVYHLAMRVTYYFMTSLVLLLPTTLKFATIKDKDKSVLRFVIAVIFIVYGLYCIYTSIWAMSFPYKFFWE